MDGTTSDWIKKLAVRHLQAKDLTALEWDGEYTHFRNVYAEAFRRYQNGLSILWVADLVPEGIIGQVFIQLTCDRPELADGINRAYLYSFRVKPQYRGLGVGSRVLQVVEQDLRQRGFHYVTLNVARENVRAQDLYRRHGYQVVANEEGNWNYIDEKGDWHHVEEPAYRMEKMLR